MVNVKDVYANGTVLLLDPGGHGGVFVAHRVQDSLWLVTGVEGYMSLSEIYGELGPFDGKPVVLEGGVNPETALVGLGVGARVIADGAVWTKQEDGRWTSQSGVLWQSIGVADKVELVKETEVLWDVR